MQSIFGALLAAGYATAATAAISAAPNSAQVNASVQAELTKSFSSAATTAQRYPQYSQQIIAGARSAFLHGDQWAYLAGIIAVLVGAVLVAVFFPKLRQERDLLAGYQEHDEAGASTAERS